VSPRWHCADWFSHTEYNFEFFFGYLKQNQALIPLDADPPTLPRGCVTSRSRILISRAGLAPRDLTGLKLNQTQALLSLTPGLFQPPSGFHFMIQSLPICSSINGHSDCGAPTCSLFIGGLIDLAQLSLIGR
jgi:hypothetical protein